MKTDNEYKCDYCHQSGGQRLGITEYGDSVCSLCGAKKVIRGVEKYFHFEKWSRSRTISTHKEYRNVEE